MHLSFVAKASQVTAFPRWLLLLLAFSFRALPCFHALPTWTKRLYIYFVPPTRYLEYIIRYIIVYYIYDTIKYTSKHAYRKKSKTVLRNGEIFLAANKVRANLLRAYTLVSQKYNILVLYIYSSTCVNGQISCCLLRNIPNYLYLKTPVEMVGAAGRNDSSHRLIVIINSRTHSQRPEVLTIRRIGFPHL